MRREELIDLNAFLAVAEHQSFTRAASKLGTSQSALSHMMKRLEARLGVRLLTRTTRKVAPTVAGERLIATLVPAFHAISAELSSLGELRDRPAGTIRLSSSDHAARTVIWPALEPVLLDYPDIQVELNIDNGLTDIVEERFDAGVRLGEQIAKDMIAVRISSELRMLVVGAPAYLSKHGTPSTPEDLARHRCINLRQATAGGLFAWELEKDGQEIRVRVDGQLVFNNTALAVQAAVAGFGLAFVMEDHVTHLLQQGFLLSVMSEWCVPFPGYHLYYPSRRQPSAAFSVILDALRYRG